MFGSCKNGSGLQHFSDTNELWCYGYGYVMGYGLWVMGYELRAIIYV
jgi:hypothetical protein